jgi:RND superfamily putative drug exporter
MPALARWCFRHRISVLVVWLVALVVCAGAAGAARTDYSNKFQLPNTPSTDALHILQHDFPAQSGDTDQIVLQAHGGSITAGPAAAAAARMLSEVAHLPHVVSVVSPYSPFGAHQVSPDGTIAFATVHFDEQAQDLPHPAIERVISVAQAVQRRDLTVALTGPAIENVQPQQSNVSTGLGVVFALIVLGLAFGAFFSAVIPILTALVAIGIGFSITGLLSHVMAIPAFAPILGVLIGLGVGVDYALFIITRHRNGLRAGRPPEDAAINAVNTAGRAVFFAGLTVCIALLGQFALGVSFLYGVAISASLTVLLTMAASLTLLPAFLRIVGLRALSRRERRRLAEDGPQAEAVTAGFWHRWSESIEHNAGARALASLLVVVVIALPVVTLRLGITDAGSDPPGSTTRVAYDLLAKGFGPGVSGPLDLVTTLTGPSQLRDFDRVVAAVAREPGVIAATPPRVSPSANAAVSVVYPDAAPDSVRAATLLHKLRGTVIPEASVGTGLHVLVGGVTAGQQDFSRVLSSKIPQFIAVVVVLAFLLLLLVFRSLLIPVIASVMNLLSVAAALGLMNAVFAWGWGAKLLGFDGHVPVEVFIPVIMFSILFGLSMDYEVFLVSRMHEEWVHTRDNTRAVTRGQAETGRVITAAALIMILVFLSFLLGGSIVIQQFGVGLAGAIVIDAFVVRTVLVPALMHLAGPANWWLPAALERRLPHLALDVPDGPVGEPDPVPAS